jgi:hypothetical protein
VNSNTGCCFVYTGCELIDRIKSITGFVLYTQDVNWARAGLGLPLLEEAVERKPGAVPVGQYRRYLMSRLPLQRFYL